MAAAAIGIASITCSPDQVTGGARMNGYRLNMIPGRFPPGSDVFSPWGSDPHLYPAVVLGVDPATQQAFVVFWDGNTAGVHDGTLVPFDLRAGTRVQANFLNNDDYAAGTVASRHGGALNVELDDGRSIWTTFAKCRIARR